MNLTVQLTDKQSEAVGRLAELNKRSKSAEATVAIEKHLEENRAALKAGAKLPKTTTKKVSNLKK